MIEFAIGRLAERIRTERFRLGLDQRQVSKLTGITQANLSRIESGKTKNIKLSTLLALVAIGYDLSSEFKPTKTKLVLGDTCVSLVADGD